MKKRLPFLALLLFVCLKSLALPFFSPPANDDCSNAIDITVATTALFTTVGATMSTTQPPVITDANDDDVWFKFVAGSATAYAYKIELTNFVDAAGGGFPPSAVIEIWTGCTNTANLVANAQGNVLMAKGLAQGSIYYIRVYTNGTALRANFNIAVMPLPAPANDNCGSATTLTPQSVCTAGEGPFTTEGASPSSQPSGDATGKDDDVWFKFTTGATNLYGKVSIINPVYSGTSSGGSVIELWGNCGDASSIKFLPFTTNGNLGTLLPNTTYYIRVYTYGTSSWIHSFNICVSLNIAPPPNDTYFTAQAMALNSGTTCTTSVTGATTAGATTEPPNDCATLSQPKDVWFKFTPTTATGHIQITNKSLLAGHTSNNSVLWMQLFDGSNTSPVLVCSNTESVDFDGHNAATTFILGHTYFLRIYNDDPANACSFDICTITPPPPAYNSCSKAVTITISPDEYCSAGIQLSNINAGASSTDGNCISNVGSDVWLKFIVPNVGADNLQLSIQNYVNLTGSASPLMGFVIYSGLTCSSLTPVVCNLGNTINLPDLTHLGPVIYVRLIFFNAADQGKFTVCLHHIPASVANIDCAHATLINASADGSAAFIHATTVGSPYDNTLTDCAGNQFVFSNAVWFKFTAAAPQQLIDIQNITGENGRNVYMGYKFYTSDGTGSCTGIIPAKCTGDVTQQNPVLSSLVVGNVYFVQVMVNTFNGDDAGFNIRAIAATPPPNDDRAGAVNLIENPFYKPSLATQGTFRFSTISPSPLTDATYGGDVWYSFKAATTAATVRVDNNGGTTRMVVYNSDGTTVFYDPGVANAVTNVTGLTMDNIYYIRIYNPQPTNATTAGSVFFISVFGSPSLDAANVATTGCQTVDGPVYSSNSETWLHITDHGKMLASIFDSNTGLTNGMGDITAAYYINTADLRHTRRGVDYLDRNYSFNPFAEPAAGHHINVIFYLTKQEFDRLAASATGRVNYMNDLTISSFTGLACTDTIGNTDEVSYRLIDYGNLSDNVYYAEVSLPHLSGFYLKTIEDATLPVTCGGFTYALNDNNVQLKWKTATEINSSHFEVQKSVNGVDYNSIAEVKASGISAVPVEYSYVDNGIKSGLNYYYRIKEFDKDGRSENLCNTIKVLAGGSDKSLFGNIYPNPAAALAKINILKPFGGKVSVQLVNAVGQVVNRQELQVTNATQTISIATSRLPTGIYLVKLITTDGVYTQKFVKQ